MKKIGNLANESGQVALMVLMIMIVMLTLGLSVAQRSLFDVQLSRQEEETSRAFQAAESGAEIALRTLAGGQATLTGDVTYDVTVARSGSGGFSSAQPVEVGETMVVDLTSASGLGSIDVYFIDNTIDDCLVNPAAIEVVIMGQSGPNTTIERTVWDVESRGNGFSVLTKGSNVFDGRVFCAKANVNISGNAVELRVRPYYDRAVIGISPLPLGAVMGDQYRLIRSEGQTSSGVTRVVEIQRGDPQAPPIFDYALFSGLNLNK